MSKVMATRFLHLRPFIRYLSNSYGLPKLSPQEVSYVLSANEVYYDVAPGSVKSFEANQLPSNNPIEDRLAAAQCKLTTGILFGVFDGHGGPNCAENISKRLLDYIALSMLPPKLLSDYVESSCNIDLIERFSIQDNNTIFVPEIHKNSLKLFAKELLVEKSSSEFFMHQAMIRAFSKLDEDMSREILEGIEKHNVDAISSSIMGACACVVHIDGTHLHLATCGDCKAVLGMLSDDNKWICKPLTQEHNADNVQELKRVFSEHPKTEINVVIKNERLLGQLAPLRAFGDFNYKWKTKVQQKYLVPLFGPGVIPPNFYTPPYLTAVPEIIHYRLTPRDKFLVIATDGLWEQMLPYKVIKFVGQHTSGKQTLDLLRLPRRNMFLKDIYNILLQRQVGLSKKPIDANAATHLIRNALGRTEYGIEHSKLSSMLTLPDDLVRNFRDDISIMVIYFDSDFLRHSPPE